LFYNATPIVTEGKEHKNLSIEYTYIYMVAQRAVFMSLLLSFALVLQILIPTNTGINSWQSTVLLSLRSPCPLAKQVQCIKYYSKD